MNPYCNNPKVNLHTDHPNRCYDEVVNTLIPYVNHCLLDAAVDYVECIRTMPIKVNVDYELYQALTHLRKAKEAYNG